MRSDGSGLRRLAFSWLHGWPWPPAWAVWSPDPSTIAVYGSGVTGLVARRWPPSLLITMARDGTDLSFLASVDAGNEDFGGDGQFHAWSPPRSEEINLAACSRGFVVPNPESNPGLVHDCETLLSIRDTLAGSTELDWNEDLTISEWEGVTVGGSPPRVHGIRLVERGLTGKLPKKLGLLTELRRLNLGSHVLAPVSTRNLLTGAIPPELGSLIELLFLDLSANYLSGRLPPELDGLTELADLDLSYNFLTGSIPLELHGLANLGLVDLGYNNPSLCVPAELPDIWRESVRLCEPEEVRSP